jgi:hypothetical protein
MSEPETRAVAQTILQFKNNIRLYLSFHSYGRLLTASSTCSAINQYSYRAIAKSLSSLEPRYSIPLQTTTKIWRNTSADICSHV